MPPDFFNPEKEFLRNGSRLPHWQQDEAMQFVTFRLGDSIPLEKARNWQEQRRLWLSSFPEPWDVATEQEYHRRFTGEFEAWLDQGMGSCLFKEEAFRIILQEVLMRFHGEKVHHEAWVIMPNHVHLLFKPLVPLAKLVGSWKSVSAIRIGRGPVWQRNYRDTMIRDGQHFAQAVRYIRNNPAKASLGVSSCSLWEGERAREVK